MWFVPLMLCAAHAQTIELTSRDLGTTVPLLAEGVMYVVDVADPGLDFDQLGLETPTRTTTFGEIFDEVLAAGAQAEDLLVVTLGDGGGVRVSFRQRAGQRLCYPLYERRCVTILVPRCVWVQIGEQCCGTGAGPAPISTSTCADHILFP